MVGGLKEVQEIWWVKVSDVTSWVPDGMGYSEFEEGTWKLIEMVYQMPDRALII